MYLVISLLCRVYFSPVPFEHVVPASPLPLGAVWVGVLWGAARFLPLLMLRRWRESGRPAPPQLWAPLKDPCSDLSPGLAGPPWSLRQDPASPSAQAGPPFPSPQGSPEPPVNVLPAHLHAGPCV